MGSEKTKATETTSKQEEHTYNLNNNSSVREPLPKTYRKYPNVFNISNTELSGPELDLLNLGLKFCPTPTQII